MRKHRLSEHNLEKRTAFCEGCNGRVNIRIQGRKKDGSEQWKCSTASRNRLRPHRQYKGEVCERCGFKPEHPCQLDVDHIDGNHSNNELDNLQTLCANCHRLKTQVNNDWTKK